MGKPKKDRKGRQDEELGDDEVDLDPLAITQNDAEMASVGTTKSNKKDKKKNRRKDDDWEEDVAAELAALSVEGGLDVQNVGAGQEGEESSKPTKKQKKKKKNKGDSDEEKEADVMVPASGKSATNKKTVVTFNMLAGLEDENEMLQSDSNDSDVNDETETADNSKKNTRKKTDDDGEEVVLIPVESETAQTSKKKEKKGKKLKKAAEEEDIDAILASLDKPTEKTKKKGKKDKKQDELDSEIQKGVEDESDIQSVVENVEPIVVTMEDLEAEEEEMKKKKKKKKEGEDVKEEGEEGGEAQVEEGDEEHTVKTAAQKKKEKKEREKKKKEQQKLKERKKEGTPVPEGEEEGKAEDVTRAEGADEEADEDDETMSKKDKKKKKGKEEKEAKKKGPSKQIAALKEHLRKQQEEEERLQQEEEEQIQKLEEARLQREELKRLEEEKKQRKKQKEKERVERLKAEGKFMTAKQKQDKKRAMQMLELMKAQGLEVPNKEDVPKKRPIYGKKKKSTQRQDSQEDIEKSPSPTEELEMTEEPSTPEIPGGEEVNEVKPAEIEAVENEEEGDDVKDAWDVSDDEKEVEEVKVKPKAVEVSIKTQATKKVESKKIEVEEDESDDEDSDDEDDESDDDEEESDDDSDESDDEDLDAVDRARIRIEKRREEAEKKRSADNLRAPVVCVLGHVDTGKTKILDKLRRTNVQDGEAGGITQQIGATNVPGEAIIEKTTMCKEFQKNGLRLPGLLIIDTPGHESFSNLRSRGSSLCDIAILVVDIMHGLEPQTIESINLLKAKKTPFIVALNKIDRLYQWKPNPNADVVNTLKKQHQNTKVEFDERTREVIVQFAEQGLNAALFHENKNLREYVSLVPTSAHSGDGMGNLVALICELSQDLLAKRIAYSEELQATVMEVKAIHGLGTTIDVILVNGKIKEGETIVIAGTEGPIITQIRGLLMPQPMKELRVKNQYVHHKEVLAAQGVKIIAKDLEKSLAGLPLYVAHDCDEVEYHKEEVSRIFKAVLSSIKLSERGVFVQASTLGSLEALLEFLRTSKIPYAGIGIGPVHKRDIMKASIMLEHDSQYAVILAFDVKVEREAQELADSLGVKVFSADIIYHLFDRFMAFRDELKKQKQDEFKNVVVFPAKVRILPQYIFNTRDPIVLGVVVEAGFIKEGTPLCVPSKEFVEIGKITSVEFNHKPMEIARKGHEVCIKIEPLSGDTPKLYGRHFDHTDLLVSKITRQSIDVVKDYFRDDMTKPDWQLIVELKKLFQII